MALRFEEVTGQIIGAAMEVHRTLGCTVALLIDFGQRSIEWKRLVFNAEQAATQ